MNFYEIINQDEFVGKDMSFYLVSELAELLIDDIHDNDQYIENFEYYEETLDESDIVIVSKLYNSDGWFVEPLSYDGKNQVYNEIDVALIQEEILEEINYDNLECESIVVLNSEDSEDNDWLDEMTNDMLEEVYNSSKDECIHCIVKKYLKMVEEITKDCTLDDVVDKINILKQ